MIVIMTGSPGSGKGTQAQLLADRHGFVQFSVGEALRLQAIHDAGLKQVLDSGALVVPSVIQEITGEFLESHQEGRGIIDGWPRNLEQGEWLLIWLDAHPNIIIRLVELTVPMDEVRVRLSLRGRDDDHPEVLEKRLEIYKAETQPLIERLKQRLPYAAVDGVGSVEEVYRRIINDGGIIE